MNVLIIDDVIIYIAAQIWNVCRNRYCLATGPEIRKISDLLPLPTSTKALIKVLYGCNSCSTTDKVMSRTGTQSSGSWRAASAFVCSHNFLCPTIGVSQPQHWRRLHVQSILGCLGPFYFIARKSRRKGISMVSPLIFFLIVSKEQLTSFSSAFSLITDSGRATESSGRMILFWLSGLTSHQSRIIWLWLRLALQLLNLKKDLKNTNWIFHILYRLVLHLCIDVTTKIHHHKSTGCW